MKYLTALLILLLTATVSYADPYLSLKGGGSFLDGESITSGAGMDTISVTEDYDTGWGGSGALGYDFGDMGLGDQVGFRMEVEGLHTSNAISEITRSQLVDVEVPCEGKSLRREVCTEKQYQTSNVGSGGSQNRNFIFVNGFFDFPLLQDFTGYVGGGYGFNAWQVIGGGKYNVTDNWSTVTEYRVVGDEGFFSQMLLLGIMYDF